MPAPETRAVPKASRHKKPLVSRRRGRKVEEEDDETVATEESYTDDSGLSEDEGSLSEAGSEEEDEDEDAEDTGHEDVKKKVVNGTRKGVEAGRTDTEVMRNGIGGGDDAHEVDFEDMGEEGAREEAPEEAREEVAAGSATELEVRGPPPTPPAPSNESPAQEKKYESHYERHRRELEEYKRRRAEDPSFVPNRGKFFMHDTRDSGASSNGYRPYGRGRGRGGKYGDFNQDPPELVESWKHDMHEAHENQEPERPAPPQQPQNQLTNYNYTKKDSFYAGRQRGPDQPRAFGRTTSLGTVQIQVNLPGMKSPIPFSEVPLKVYTRLPFHRPPLRRDKPVRVALPDAPVRYIYPSFQRSFIFIPRAMRPGGSGYIRGAGRGRVGYQGGYQAGRSMYGGSTIYSPSVGMSRRSSLTYDVRQQTPAQAVHAVVPVPPMQTRPMASGNEEAGRPIVRLPSATSAVPSNHSVQQEAQPMPAPPPPPPQQQQPQPPQVPTPRMAPQPPPSFTPSINPIPYREHRATPKIPMHQPRPQKAVNVSEIDSPAIMHFPQNYASGAYDPSGSGMNGYAHSRHPSYPSQASGTPLSQIPEAVHARPFQPYPVPPQGPYYAHPAPHPYPPPPGQMPPPPMPPPTHGYQVPPQPPYVPSGPTPMPNGMTNHYAVAGPPPQQVPPPAPVQAVTGPPPAQPAGPTTVAHESHGMVYYTTYDPSQYQYPPPVAYPGTPGSMPITPAPDGSGAVYGTPAGPVPVHGTVYYYPTGTSGYYGP